MFASLRCRNWKTITSDLQNRFELSDKDIEWWNIPAQEEFDNLPYEGRYQYQKKIIENLRPFGWKLVSVAWVGGCRAVAYETFYFINDRDQY